MPRHAMVLTTGEKLFLDRSRRGETQRQAAVRYGVAQWRYGEWERGLAPPWGEVPELGPLKERERYIIWRRRAGWTQASLARRMGCSRLWVWLMENGKQSADHLYLFWRRHNAKPR